MKSETNNENNSPEEHGSSMSFEIRRLEILRDNANGFNLCSQKDKFVIIWIINGHGSFGIYHNTGFISTNELLFVRPGQFNSLEMSEDASGYMITFTPAFINITDKDSENIYQNIYQICEFSQAIKINDELIEDLRSIIGCMLREYIYNNLYRMEILKRYFRIFLIYLSRQFDHAQEVQHCTRSEEIMESFMSMLEEKFRTKKMVADYAEALAVTPNYLNEVIKKITGRSVGYHIRQRVALEAKRQAVYSNISMKSIAYDLGFNDMSHFSKFFKNMTGVNFSDFKNRDGILQTVA